MKITTKHLDEWGACDRGYGKKYDNQHFLVLSNGKNYILPCDIANHVDISTHDKIWVLLHPKILNDKFVDVLYKYIKRAYKYAEFNLNAEINYSYAHLYYSYARRINNFADYYTDSNPCPYRSYHTYARNVAMYVTRAAPVRQFERLHQLDNIKKALNI